MTDLEVVDLCTPPPSPPRPAGQPLREVDGGVMLDSDAPTLTTAKEVSLMFNERRTPAAERQREWRMDPRAFSD